MSTESGSRWSPRGIAAVTGMHRSGTSCVAGLLVRCGFSLGTSHRMLNDNASRFDNQRGHFENLGVVAINDAILGKAGGAWYRVPPPQSVESLAVPAGGLIGDFARLFNGTVIKDPRLSLTLPLWKRSCPSLSYAVFCVRHPLGVARSLASRNKMSLQMGLGLWLEYNLRLAESINGLTFAIVDFDQLTAQPTDTLCRLLSKLGVPFSEEKVGAEVDEFFDKELNHNPLSSEETASLPEDVKKLYTFLRARAV